MAIPKMGAMALTRWVQYWLLEGQHEEDVRAQYERRFPDRPITEYMTALRYARRAIAVGERVTQLDPSQPLSDALGRGNPPDPNVSVRLLFRWVDQSGHVFFNTIRVSAQWTMTVDDVLAAGREILAAITSRYGGAIETSVEIVPAVLFPSGEQL